MNNLKITILFLLTSGFASAQSTEVLVGEVMTALRQGEYADVNRQTIYNASVDEVIKAVSPFLNDTLPTIRSKAYSMVNSAGLLKEDDGQRKLAVEFLSKGISDKDSGVGYVTSNALTGYNLADFNQTAKNTIDSYLNSSRPYHFDLVVKLAGFIGSNAGTLKFLSNSSELGNTDKIAIYQAMARMGEQEQINFFVSKVSTLPVDDSFMYEIGPVLIYIRQPEAINVLVQALMSDEKNCDSADPDKSEKVMCAYKALELLAPVIKDLPIEVDKYGDIQADDMELALNTTREWFRNNSNNYQIIKDHF